MFKKLLLVFALASFLAAPALAQDKVYINGIDADFPPFAFVGPDGQPTGFDVDAINWIAKEMGFQVTHQPLEWSGIVANLKARKIDMIASGLSVSEERATQIAFSLPYWTIKQVILCPSDSDLTPEQVLSSGREIGVQTGTSDAEAMAAANGKDGRNYVLKEYPSPALAAEDVVNGRLIAAVMNDAPAADLVAKRPLKIVGEAGLPEELFAVGVAIDDPQTLEMINQGLTKLMADPYWQELIEKYKPGDVH
ncbi:MAG: ABC transporter substrate-binding protein [Deltaproteobacteria bacterium]|jgi:polar amino acid transport system substrate-binding protein|nr:ABC transporter substrate-binding protein [Deltaproteobacteria bacterium]